MKRGSMHMMSTRLLRGAGAAVLFAALSCAQTGPGGHWEGAFTVGNREIGLTLDLARNDQAEWIASMGMPAPNAIGMPINDVKQAGDRVEFGLKIAHASFQGTLNKDRGELTGQLGHDEQAMQVTLKKKELPCGTRRAVVPRHRARSRSAMTRCC